jgi:hypothetical protein
MNNMEVFDRGKILETFNYMDEYDFENTHMGYLVELNGIVYQIIATENNILINPESEASIFTSDINDVYSQIEKDMKEPIKIETRMVGDDYFENKSDIQVDDGVIKYKGNVIVNRFTNQTVFDEYKELDSWKNETSEQQTGNTGIVDNNIIDFNTPW